jgi:hypothetical protein
VPVVVGVATATQRIEDPTEAVEALALMARAIRSAGEDAGGADPASSIGSASRGDLGVPTRAAGWRWAAGVDRTRSRRCADVGILQQDLSARSGGGEGEARAGRRRGEARYRDLRARITGTAGFMRSTI